MLGLSLSIPFKPQMSGSAAGYSEQYQAVYDQFSSAPSAADAEAQNTFVQSLVDAGVWTELDRLFVLAAHDGTDALIDWINPTGTGASLVNAPTFVQYQGYTGNGSTSYINSNYNPTSNGTNFIRDDALFGVYSRTDSIDTVLEVGASDGTTHVYFFTNYSSGAAIRLNQTTNSGWSGKGNSLGLSSGERDGASSVRLFQNGTEITGVDGARLSNALVNQTMYMLARNNSGAPANHSSRQVSMIYFGGALDTAKQLALYNAFQTLMTYYGTQV